MMHRMLHLIVMMTLSGTIGATWLHAQDYPDSKGRDFWFTFLPNFHNNADSLPNRPNEAREHRLYVFIGADSAATGTITTYDRQGVLKSTPFSITDPTKLFEWSDFYAPYELVGFQRGGRLDYTNNQCEVPTKLYFHITADVDVTVYALNQATFTSDAFLILPTDALGQDYVVMSYPSSISGQPNSSTPSEFVITATEDDTDIEIIPTAPTVRNVQDTQRIVLQQGESYLVQVDTRDETFGDLTGTSIVASRPIAVFSGHQRTTIPMQNSQLSSRDCLVEQLNPVTTWGRRSFIAPFPRSSDEENVGNDIYRLVSRFDSTSITVNGVDAGMLMAGQVFEAPLLEAVDVRTTRPVLVAQFKKTSSTTSSGQLSNTGDPLMMLVPPSEEFLNSYTFINVQSRRIVQTNFGEFEDDVYKEQYATVVMPEPRGNGTSSADYFNLTLDGQPITPAVRQIGTSKWVYFTQRMTDGVHRISADTLIGLYVFGYGQAVSYGYIGGMSFRPLDVYPPAIDDTVQCSSGAVSITDTVIGDKGIDSVWFGARQNIADNGWRVIATPRERRETSISLGNPYMDGFIEILAIDVEEQIARKRIDIAGFTVAPLTHNGQGAPMARTWVLARKRQRCDTVIFENYGSFPRTITNVRFASGAPVNIAVPFTLAPGETFEVATCRQFDSVVTQLDTIYVEDACRVRAAVAYEIEVQNDKLFPRVSTDVDPCSTQVNISIREDDPSDFGLEYVRVVDSLTRNCTVVITGEMPKRQDIAITVIDPYDDALYYVEALDSAGNEQIVADTIYGFTLEVAGVRGAIRSAAPASVYLGDVACVELPIHNYGLGRITIDRASMSENLRFSLPPGQFPISLAPGDSGTLTVCYEPVGSDTTGDVDSLVLQQQCLDIRLNVDGKGLPLALDGISRCNLPVEVTVLAAASAAPLPAGDLVTIGLPIEFTAASVRLIDMAGTNVGRFDLPAGTPARALRIGVGTIAEGVYVALVEAHGMVFSTLVVIRR